MASKRKKIEAAGGILFKRAPFGPIICMILRNSKWDLPKGKLEKGETIETCAIREVEEELGITQVRSSAYLTDTFHSYTQKGKDWDKTTYWYAMTAPDQLFTPQVEEGIEEVQWETPQQALTMVAFDNLKKVIAHFILWYEQNGNEDRLSEEN